jgi:serine/threonine protein kinase
MFDTLAHYRLLDRIGAGGMGDIYRARDTHLGRTVAITVLTDAIADDHERRDRFLRDARAAAALSHPNIAALYEIGEDRGHLFLAFEFVPGDTLAAVIGGRPMNPRRALAVGAQLADAVADAHASGIVHRDLRPANVIVTPKGNPKILDFGLATWAAGGAAIAYMSPEQALGETVDHRTDIFSLGVMLYEMVTGTLPFQTPAPVSVNAALPRELDAVIAKAVANKPADRYESAALLAEELRSAAARVDARQESVDAVRMPTPGSSRRRSYVAVVAALVILAVIGAALWIAWN